MRYDKEYVLIESSFRRVVKYRTVPVLANIQCNILVYYEYEERDERGGHPDGIFMRTTHFGILFLRIC